MQQDRQPEQMDVVCKITPTTPGEAEALQSPRFAPELSCCLQDERRRSQRAKPVRRNVLSPELRCCWQDCTVAASGPGASAAGDCARQPPGAFRGIVSSNRDGGRAIARTVAAHLSIFPVGGDLLSVVVGAPLSLAPGPAADRLAGLEFR